MLLQVFVSMEGACVRRDVTGGGGGCDSPTQQKGQSSRTQFTISWLDDLS